MLQSQQNRQTVERGLQIINNRVALLIKDEERMNKLIEETRKRAQKLQKIKEESEQGYLTRL